VEHFGPRIAGLFSKGASGGYVWAPRSVITSVHPYV